MKFDLSESFDQNKARTRLENLIQKGAKIELTEFRNKRTNLQNRYWHYACGVLSKWSGYTIDEIKTILKDQLEFMTYSKGDHKFYRSSADLDTKEFADLVDFTRSFAEEHGEYIPTPDEYYEDQFKYEKLIQ